MKAITVSQPFASLIASGEKWVENRRWHCGYRGPLAIHAGKGKQYMNARELQDYPTGCIVAIADMIACINLEASRGGKQRHEVEKMAQQGVTLESLLAHEHAEGPYCFVLSNVRKLTEPIDCRGAQGLWDVPLAEVLAIRAMGK